MPRISAETRKAILLKWCKEKITLRKLAKSVNCSKSAVYQIIKKFGEHNTIDDLPKSRRRKGPVCKKTEESVVKYLNSGKSLSVREIAKKVKISVGSVQNIKKRNNIKTFKKQKIPKRSAAQQDRAKKRSRRLYKILVSKSNCCILMDDETYVKMDSQTLPGPQFYNAVVGENVSDEVKAIKVDKFGKKVLVWQAICSCGLKSSTFFIFGTIGGDIYRNECLKKRLFPLYHQHDIPPLFWPDLATAHYAKETLDLMKANNVDFVEKEDNPPNCPQLRPIERYWANVKRYLQKNGQEAGNIADFKKMWAAASRKVSKDSVRKLMKNIRVKVRNFSRE